MNDSSAQVSKADAPLIDRSRSAHRAIAHAFALHRAGNLAAAERLYREILTCVPDQINALQLLGVLLLGREKALEAAGYLERAISLLPTAARHDQRFAVLANNLGNAYSALGRHKEAVGQYQASLAIGPSDPEVHANLASALLQQGDQQRAIAELETAVALRGRADWLHQLAKIHAARGDLRAAENGYVAALEIDPAFAPGLRDLAALYVQSDRIMDALALYERLQRAVPDDADVWRLLGDTYRQASLLTKAVEAYKRHLAKMPDAWFSYVCLGMALSQARRHPEAIAAIEKGIALAPAPDPLAITEFGNVLLRAGDEGAAFAQFRKASALQPVMTRRAAQEDARGALFLFAPGRGNTPYIYLLGRAPYHRHMVSVLPDFAYDLSLLRAAGEVVVNLISDADQGEETLPLVKDLVGGLGKPVVNHPDKVARTDRVSTANLLRNIPKVRVAHVVRVAGAALLATPSPGAIAAFTFPFLARIAGMHGGDAFEKVDTVEELQAFVARAPDVDYYLMDYIDYQSADGFYRKYRFFCVDGAVMPYHLAICGQWKVHHFRTEMADQPWMQDEEKAFLAHTDAVFGVEQRAALATLTARLGLDFMGIDCGLDRDGNVVVFEANATMLLNGNTHQFPYRAPYVRAIKAAFDAMLIRRMSGG